MLHDGLQQKDESVVAFVSFLTLRSLTQKALATAVDLIPLIFVELGKDKRKRLDVVVHALYEVRQGGSQRSHTIEPFADARRAKQHHGLDGARFFHSGRCNVFVSVCVHVNDIKERKKRENMEKLTL